MESVSSIAFKCRAPAGAICYHVPMLKRMAISVAFALVFSAAVRADFEKGVAAYDSGDYQTASREFRESAAAGNADAQVIL
ncbi:MAG: hypothetical protein WAL83_12530, partial [Arenicellales bacterium]